MTANAGGVNGEAVRKQCARWRVNLPRGKFRIGRHGDDTWIASTIPGARIELRNYGNGRTAPTVRERNTGAKAYLGAGRGRSLIRARRSSSQGARPTPA